MSVLLYLAVVLLCGSGSVLRFLLDSEITERRARGPFPIGTLVVNLSGAALIGIIVGLSLSHDSTLLAGTAAVGSYTTFSTWMLETRGLAAGGRASWAAFNVAASLVLGVAAVALGDLISGQL